MDIGQTEIATGVMVGESFMVQAQCCENGRLNVVNMNRILRWMESKVIGGTHVKSTLHSAAAHP